MIEIRDALRILPALAILAIVGGCGGGGSSADTSTSSGGSASSSSSGAALSTLQSISITPNPAYSGVGISVQLTAIGTYSDGSTANVTDTATWASDTQSVATIAGTTGKATGATVGSTSISASIGSVTTSVALSVVEDSWEFTGSLETGRSQSTATQLPNGEVLVIGGITGSQEPGSQPPELYDPVSGTWSRVPNLASPPLSGQSATLLSNGEVLVAGGTSQTDPTYVMTSNAELYDPVFSTWNSAGRLVTARSGHTATLLANGMVLIAGGQSGATTLASAELYDPIAGTWSATGSMTSPRFGHTATLLANGSVLVAGGGDYMGVTAEIYDPTSGTWSRTGGLNVPRENHTAILLQNGTVLIAGGYGGPGNFVIASSEIYDPVAGGWTSTGSLITARGLHTATLLPNGSVLVAGGIFDNPTTDNSIASAEVYDPVAGTWSSTGSLKAARAGHTATLLTNGAVLVTGGSNDSELTSCELYL